MITEWGQVLQVPRSCTSMYVTHRVVDYRTGRSGRTAKARAGERRRCRDAGGPQNFAAVVGRQFMFQETTWTTSLGWLHFCNPAGVLEVDFQLSFFFVVKVMHTSNWFCCEGAVLWRDSCRNVSAFFNIIYIFLFLWWPSLLVCLRRFQYTDRLTEHTDNKWHIGVMGQSSARSERGGLRQIF